tara:strand:- start:632 stop:1501 length:870 start_codon:yes stop_codon:yes gene_type:complete
MRQISFFLVTIFLISCTEQKKSQPNFKGIWKSVANVTYEDFNLKDSFVVKANKYKYIDEGNELWFSTNQFTDSLGEIKYNDYYMGGKAKFSSDSVNVVIDVYHDSALKNSNWINWIRNIGLKTGWNGIFSFVGDFMKWGNIDEKGNGWFEIWEKVDEIGSSPSSLTGKYDKVSTKIVRKNGSVDSIAFNTSERVHNRWFFGDKKLVRVNNSERKDSLGNDRFVGAAFYSSYEFFGDSLQENYIHFTSNLPKERQEEGFRKFKASLDKDYFQFTMSFSGGEYTQFFKKID